MINELEKKINTISLIFALLIPPLFLSWSFFKLDTESPMLYILKSWNYIAIISFIYYFVFKKLAEKDILKANTGLFLVNFGYILSLIWFTGGADSPFFPIFYLFIILGFFISLMHGIGATIIVSLFIVLDVYLQRGILAFIEPVFLYKIISVLVTLVPSFFFGDIYRKNNSDKRDMSKMVETLSSNKNQEEVIFNSIADGIYAVDNERNLVLFNAVASEMTGWEEKTALGIKCWTVMKLRNEEDVSVCEKDCPMLQVWNTGENLVRDDICFMNKSKKNIQISGAYSPIKDINGKITGGLCVFRDITKQKEVERLRNEFVSTASHELRTPITTLEGYISLASNEKVAKIDDKAKEYLDKAHNAVLGMANLVKNLLSVTKIEEGKLETNVEHFEINKLIEQIVEELSPLAKNKGLTLEFKKSHLSERGKKSFSPNIKVIADQSMIKEVLTNLIENGIKFTTKGSVELEIGQDKEFATVKVIDTGMGIQKDGQKHLFEKFYRVDNTATREVGGTGLGLYITRSIVENFGGKITVDSKEGSGTAFTFTIPKSLD